MGSLHDKGISGFDIAPIHIFCNDSELPQFALIPTVIYDDLFGKNADIFSIAMLIFQLITGETIPFTPIGLIDQNKFEDLIQHFSTQLWNVVLQILKNEKKSLKILSDNFKNILFNHLSPQSSSQKV